MLSNKLQMLNMQHLKSWNLFYCITLGFLYHFGRMGISESTRLLHCFCQLNCCNMHLVSDQLLLRGNATGKLIYKTIYFLRHL